MKELGHGVCGHHMSYTLSMMQERDIVLVNFVVVYRPDRSGPR